MDKPKYIYIVGPTGIGKTELSISIAQEHNLPIINSDSLQVYKRLNIGTAKPNKEEMSLAQHLLFDYVDPPRELTASDYIKDVAQIIDTKKIKSLIFVGGSGFYIQALEKGMFPCSETPENIKNEIKEWVAKEEFLSLYQWLQKNDPEYADQLSINDHYRIQRAVEIMKTQSKKMSQLKKEMKESNYSLLRDHESIKIGLRMEKDLLRKRIEKRTALMLDSGFLEEVRGLLDEGLKDWAPLRSIGYKECVDHLSGDLSREELFERIVISTMQLIKKQMTWFKRDSSIRWFEVEKSDQALTYIDSFIVPSIIRT